MRKAGFTLVEVLVAMVVAALAISIAAAMFGTSTDSVRRASALSSAWTREANLFRWVDQLLSGMEVDNTPEGMFEGEPRGARFWSRFPVSAGWLEEGRMELLYDGRRLLSRLPDGRDIVLGDSLSDVWFDYLLSFGANSTWLTGWRSGATQPVGIRLRLHRGTAPADTLLFFIGERT